MYWVFDNNCYCRGCCIFVLVCYSNCDVICINGLGLFSFSGNFVWWKNNL